MILRNWCSNRFQRVESWCTTMPRNRHRLVEHLVANQTALRLREAVILNCHASHGQGSAIAKAITLADLRQEVDDLAIQFYIRGWQQEDSLCLYGLARHLSILLAFFAAARLGMLVTLVNGDCLANSLQSRLTVCKSKYLITTNHLHPIVKETMTMNRSLKEVLILDRSEQQKETETPAKDKNFRTEWKPTTEFDFDPLLRSPPAWGKLPTWNNPPNRKFLSLCLPGELSNPSVSISQSHLLAMVTDLSKLVRRGGEHFSEVVLAVVERDDFLSLLASLYSLSREGSKFIFHADLDLESLGPILAANNVTTLFFYSMRGGEQLRISMDQLEKDSVPSGLRTIFHFGVKDETVQLSNSVQVVDIDYNWLKERTLVGGNFE